MIWYDYGHDLQIPIYDLQTQPEHYFIRFDVLFRNTCASGKNFSLGYSGQVLARDNVDSKKEFFFSKTAAV